MNTKTHFLMKSVLAFCYFLTLSILFFSCKKTKIEIQEATQEELIAFRQPFGFPSPVYPIHERPIDAEKFKLGRELFYSTELSSNNTVSCASCHAQAHHFADHNIAFSVGVNGAQGVRNAPPIFNMAWQPHFMWDGGINHLEVLSLAPITNPVEMNETMPNVLLKLNNSSVWKSKFKKAFGTNEITDQQLFVALTQFMLLIVSDQTVYDRVMQGNATFTSEQQAGYTLFQQHCAACHAEPLFTDFSFRNNGLQPLDQEQGRFTITQNENDRGTFKVPTLRNVLFTYPYMHDGRFFTIDQVLEHYNTGVQQHANVDPAIANGISLSVEDKKNLKRFLETLNDYELLGNSILSEPN